VKDHLADVPEFGYTRERHITTEDKNAEAAVKADTSVSASMVKEVFNQVDGLLEKSDTLLDEIKRTANPYIPVDKNALEVQLALRSLYPGSPTDRISYDQYIASVQFAERQGNVDPVILHNSMTGNGIIDSRILSQQTTLAANDDMTPEELLVIGGQFLMLAVCNRMLQTFQAPNTQMAVAGKQPAGTEIAATSAQFLIGMAAILLQALVTEDEVKQVLKKTFGEAMEAMNTNADAVVAEAKAKEQDPLLKDYQRSQTDQHHTAIREYSQDYVANTTEPGYETWVAAEDVRSIRADAQASKNESENYLSPSASYQMSTDVYKLMACRNKEANNRLNKLAAVLSSKYTRDLVCCFVKFVGGFPTETLKFLRLILQVLSNGVSQDLGAAANSLRDSMNSFLERSVLEPILHLIDNFFREAAEMASSLLDPNRYDDPEAFEEVLACSPIDELFTYVFSGLEKVRALLVKYIRKYWSKIQMKNRFGSVKVQILADNKRAKMLLRILDEVIAAADRGNLCAEKDAITPSTDDVDDVVEKILNNLPAPIQLTPAEGALDSDPFRTFSSADLREFTSAEGLLVLGQPDKEAGVKRGLSDCARDMINESALKPLLERGAQMAKGLRNVDSK